MRHAAALVGPGAVEPGLAVRDFAHRVFAAVVVVAGAGEEDLVDLLGLDALLLGRDADARDLVGVLPVAGPDLVLLGMVAACKTARL